MRTISYDLREMQIQIAKDIIAELKSYEGYRDQCGCGHCRNIRKVEAMFER